MKKMTLTVVTVYRNMTMEMLVAFSENLSSVLPPDVVEDLVDGETIKFTSVDGELCGTDFTGELCGTDFTGETTLKVTDA